jgi:hypothetical protein
MAITKWSIQARAAAQRPSPKSETPARVAHGYEPTHEAAMAAFAKS